MIDNNKEIVTTLKNSIKPPPLGSRGASIRVFAPATVANVVCGFDVLGFAVNEPGDEVIMRVTN
ncbi:MAG: homoserine kinase, partial [Mucilaginibacter sp.]